MKRKVRVDFEKVRKFWKQNKNGMDMSDAMKKFNSTREDILKAMQKWMSEHTYDPILREWT